MNVTITKKHEPKPLADFCCGDTFLAEDAGELKLYSVIDIGVEDWQTPHTNICFCLDLEESRVVSFRDDIVQTPIDAEIDLP